MSALRSAPAARLLQRPRVPLGPQWQSQSQPPAIGWTITPRHQARPASSSSFRDHGHDEFTFKPPPISARLRPLVPFFIYWCIITSLAVHLLRTRIQSKEELDKAQAQISVLEGLIERYRQGERVGPEEIRRELEMVGLRERLLTQPEEGEGGDVGWMKAIFGRRGVQDEDDEAQAQAQAQADEQAVEQWAKGIYRILSLVGISIPSVR